jgi:hypothetical protein
VDTDSPVSITLTQRVRETTFGPPGREQLSVWPPPGDENLDAEILAKLQANAAASGLAVTRDTETHHRMEAEVRGVAHYGGPPLIEEFSQLLTYAGPYLAQAGLAAGGFAAFVRNVLGSINEWKTLRQGRSVTISVHGRPLKIRDGASVEEVVRTIEDALSRKRREES